MTEKELFREVGKIKEEYIVEAEAYKRSVIHHTAFKSAMATAACLILCLGIYWGTDSLEVRQSMDTADMTVQSIEDIVRQEADFGEPKSVEDQKTVVDLEDKINNVIEEAEPFPKEEPALTEDDITINNATAGQEAAINETSADKTVGAVQASPLQQDEVVNADEALKQREPFETEAVKNRLAAYSETLEELRREAVYIILHGKPDYGQKLWEEFVQQIEARQPASIDIVQFTEEGAPIIIAVSYDGEVFHVLYDNTRASGGSPGIREDTYSYLNVVYSDDLMEVILSQQENLTKEQLYSGDYDIFQLLQCNIE